ncbi:hypothetical protein DLREEDagr8_16460 [Dongia sp. agr-C8]
MPPTPIKTALIPAALGAPDRIPRLMDDPALDRAVKEQIVALVRRFDLARVAAMVEANFNVTVSREQILAVWNGRHARRTEPPSPAEPSRSDKESVHPADAPPECLLIPPAAAPDPTPPLSFTAEAPPTRTGPGQEEEIMPDPVVEMKDAAPDPATTEPHQIVPAEVREFIIARMARQSPPWAIAKDVERDFGFVVDRDEIIVCWRDRDAPPASIRTGPGPEKESRPRLNDEVKEFIVKRLACYETPSRIAAAVRVNFGIDVDRRRVFDYDPTGSRPPAQRWIDLHAATRARFLRDVAEIGVAQKVIRLRMLDRFAAMAEDDNCHDKAAKYLAQAARECGGFYDKQPLQMDSAPLVGKVAGDQPLSAP